ncbi:MAG: PD40 domain-containing protein [Myxococcales bacterium]|nr:PD40 domain-containing protein [Myxococcales bacterium]
MRARNLTALLFATLLGVSCGQREVKSEGTYFDRKISPILQGSCATSATGSSCHVTADERGNALGNLDVTSYQMVTKRRDLLEDYGSYGMPALLAKAVPPQTILLTHYDGTQDTFDTDIPHAGGSILDVRTSSFQTLLRWLERGATENNTIATKSVGERQPCVEAIGTDPLFDPSTDPANPDYATFVSDVNPFLVDNCAAANCHGSTEAPFPVSCGKTDEQKRWNYFSASDYVAKDPQYSDILTHALNPASGGVYHPGGWVFSSSGETTYQKILSWAAAKGGPTNIPTDAGFDFFAKRVQPMLVKRGCVLMGCHSSPVFNEFRPRAPGGGHFGIAATRHNYREVLKRVALESADPNAGRIVRKNLPPGPGGPGIRHRGGSLFAEQGGDPANCDLAQAETGPLSEQSPYCVLVAWLAKERTARMESVAPLSGIVYVRRAPVTQPEMMQDWETYLPGADLRWIDAAMDATGDVTTAGNDKSLLGGCGLDAPTADVRRPSVSWDGKKIAFAARSAGSAPYQVYVMNADGSACAPEPTINAAPTDTAGGAIDTKGELIHNFDPAFAPDGTLVFTSSRGNILPGHLFPGPQRSAADPAKLNANLYALENGKIRQLTFLSNQEMYPGFKSNGQLLVTAEKRVPGFYQIAARRMNLDGGDYHPLYGQRAHFGYLQLSETAELLDQNLVGIASDRNARHLAGTLVVINRSLGQDNVSQNPDDYAVNPDAVDYASTPFFQHSLSILDPAATGRVGASTQGAYRNPSALPNGNILVSYAAGVTDLGSFDGGFDVVMVNATTGARSALPGLDDAATDELWPVAVFGRVNQGVFRTTPGGDPVFHGVVYDKDDEQKRTDRFQLTIVDFPMLASLLFQSTRSGRHVEDMSSFEAWASLPPETEKSLNDPSPYIVEDQYGKVYARRVKVGTVPLLPDGSVKLQAPAGYPVVLAVQQRMKGEPKPTLHHQLEEIQFYPGEWLTLSFRREVFSNFCGGCHGPVSGKEFDVSIKPDLVSQASKCDARDADPIDATKSPLNEILGPPFP